jgi:hypothetical protein
MSSSGEEIANVNKKLEHLSDTIRDVARNQNVATTISSRPSHDLSRLQDGSPSTTDIEIPYEGDSSFAAQTKSIAMTLDSAFRNASKRSTQDQPSATLANIHSLLKDVETPRTAPSSTPSGRMGDISSLPVVPVGVVLKILRFSKGQLA